MVVNPTGRPHLQGFISYTHRDSEQLDRFVVHLKAIERLTPFGFWYDKRRLQAGDATRWILREHSLEQIACVLRGALTGFRQARLDERLGAHFGCGSIHDVDRGASESALNHTHKLG